MSSSSVFSALKQLTAAMALAVPMLAIGSASAFADSFGAIAWSNSSKDKGYAWDYSTRREAESRALSECTSVTGSNDCRVLLWFKNACGSIAESSDGAAGTGWGSNTALAERYALQTCSDYGSGCRVTRTICSE